MSRTLTIIENDKKIVIILFIAIVAGGAVLRFWNLGEFGFSSDEIFHVIGAKSILEVGSPIFPSGDEYKRAIGFTYIIAIFFKLFGISETVARMPSVIFNIIFLLLSFVIVRKWFNTRVAIFYLFAMNFSPFCISMSRECRMYSLFQLFYFLGTVVFFHGLEYTGSKWGIIKNREPLPVEKKYGINLSYLFLSVFFLCLSFHLHSLTVTFGVVVIAYIVSMCFATYFRHGYKDAILSKYGMLFLVCVCFLLLGLVCKRDIVADYVTLSRCLPSWALYLNQSIHYYRYFLSDNYPIIFFFYPLGILYLMKQKGRLGLFIFYSFFLLFAVHSILFKWHGHRYIFYIFPFFVLGVSALMEEILPRIWNMCKRLIKSENMFSRILTCGALIIAMNGLAYPWFMDSKNTVLKARTVDWKEFYNKTGKFFEEDSCLIATEQNRIYYYFGRKPDYYLRVGYYDQQNDADYFSGATPITTLEELRGIIAENKRIYLVSTSNNFTYSLYTTKEIRELIYENFKEVHLNYSSQFRLFEYKQKN